MPEDRIFPIPLATNKEIAEFIERYGKPYDAAIDEYQRDPFIADIREGKNDPIYNAHSYHTKVPPRAIIPYILHYTQPGDIVLDPFCGSGMTGVAALMCEDPPNDLLKMVAGARKGVRRAIINDLSPAACHIAYNYCTPVDFKALKAEFERIKASVKVEFEWLYGTEHYEPAVGIYDPTNAEVARRLKNPPEDACRFISLPDQELTWELLDRGEVERRMGPKAIEAHPLPENVNRFISIPATIQYTIWSDVYMCEGMVSVEESTGRMSKGGKPVVKRGRRPRGCGVEIVLWHAAVNHATGQVAESFVCPSCGLEWKKIQLKRIATVPIATHYQYVCLVGKKKGRTSLSSRPIRKQRLISAQEVTRLKEIEKATIPYWFPREPLDPKGPQYSRNALSARNVRSEADFYTHRNLRALARFWHEFSATPESRTRAGLLFLWSSIYHRCSRRTKWHRTRLGQAALSGQLYIPSLQVENNILLLLDTKLAQIIHGLSSISEVRNAVLVSCNSAGKLVALPEHTVDYVFCDPPFGSNIYYSEVNLLWESWLGLTMDRSEEAVVHRKNDRGTKTISDYARLMTESFVAINHLLKPGRFATVEFNNSDGQVFEAIKQAVRDAGFMIENMVFLDKVQKTFKQIKGDKGEEDVVGHDVIFNLRKPALQATDRATEDSSSSGDGRLEHLIVNTIRDHLRSLPGRMKADPKTYTDRHRTTAFLNTMLMNALIPQGINVERLNLPYIESVCSQYFRKVDNRWFLRDEAVGNHKPDREPGTLYQNPDEEVVIKDETTAIEWLRQRLSRTPMRIGELRPHWMRATVMLTGDISARLEQFLRDHFWLDRETRRWREPTEDERAQMDNIDRQRARDEAERFLAGTLRQHTSGEEILGWIEHLYASASLIEEEAVGLSDAGQETALPADAAKLYAMMPRLFQAVLKETVDSQRYALCQRQCRIASAKLAALEEQERQRRREHEPAADKLPLFRNLKQDE